MWRLAATTRQGAKIDLESATVVAETGRLEVRFPGDKLGYEGKALLAGSVTGDQFFGWTSLPNGANPSFRGTRTAPFQGDAVGTVAVNVPKLDLPFIRPMMEYGVPRRRSSPLQSSFATRRSGRRGRRVAWKVPTS